ncbi:MAG: 1-deoxy-D-xylulose-5-phosphate reductoisomerase, partial [Candidatus Hinthialibacter sp.]
LDSFPCLSLAYEAAQTGGTMPAYLSVANEEAVSAYLNGRICFGAIPRVLAQSMKRHSPRLDYTLEDIQEADRESRKITQEILESL